MITDSEKIKLVATVIIRRLCINSWITPDGKRHPPCFTGDVAGPVTKEDEYAFANLRKHDQELHDQIWTDAAAICEALERGSQQ